MEKSFNNTKIWNEKYSEDYMELISFKKPGSNIQQSKK